MEQFDPGRAAEAFRRALALDPKLTVARVNLAIAYLYAPDLPNARQEAEQALAEAPSMPQVHYVLALVARLENRPSDAEKSLAATARHRPGDAGANITLGQVLIDQERYADAIPRLEAAIAAEPHNASAYYNLAMALGRGGRMDEGKKMMARFQEVRKNPSHVTLGKGYMEQGRYAEAVVSTGLEPGLVPPGVPDVRFVDRTATILGKADRSPGDDIHLADMNADGRLDALLATPAGLRLLLNGPAGFEDVSASWGLSGVTAIAAVAADLDNDARPDVVVLGKDRLLVLHNDGSRMIDVSSKAALSRSPSGSSALALVDFDHDGDLDIFVPGLLLRNNGDGTFLDTTKDAGLELSAVPLAVAPTDFDNRRDVDLAVLSSDGRAALPEQPRWVLHRRRQRRWGWPPRAPSRPSPPVTSTRMASPTSPSVVRTEPPSRPERWPRTLRRCVPSPSPRPSPRPLCSSTTTSTASSISLSRDPPGCMFSATWAARSSMPRPRQFPSRSAARDPRALAWPPPISTATGTPISSWWAPMDCKTLRNEGAGTRTSRSRSASRPA